MKKSGRSKGSAKARGAKTGSAKAARPKPGAKASSKTARRKVSAEPTSFGPKPGSKLPAPYILLLDPVLRYFLSDPARHRGASVDPGR